MSSLHCTINYNMQIQGSIQFGTADSGYVFIYAEIRLLIPEGLHSRSASFVVDITVHFIYRTYFVHSNCVTCVYGYQKIKYLN